MLATLVYFLLCVFFGGKNWTKCPFFPVRQTAPIDFQGFPSLPSSQPA
jgi:hypothetical protein